MVDNFAADEDKHLYRRGVGFLKKAQNLRGLSPAAVDRIERRLQQPRPRPGRRPLWVAATVSCVVLLVGTLAVARVGLRRVPLLRALFVPKTEPVSAPAPRPRRMVGKATTPPSSPAPAMVGKVTTPPSSPAPIMGPSPIPALGNPEILPAPRPMPAPTGAGTANATPAPASRPIMAEVAKAPAPRAMVVARHEPSRPAQPDTRQPLAALPAKTRAPEPASAVIERTPPPENPVLAESRSFSTAIAHWHRSRDPVAALQALDEHERHFPNGHMQMESRLLRAEILLAQGRERDGLALLDGMNLAGLPRARELLTVRGELRIKAGRCREGRADLDQVLTKGIGDSFGKRAAAALAGCP